MKTRWRFCKDSAADETTRITTGEQVVKDMPTLRRTILLGKI